MYYSYSGHYSCLCYCYLITLNYRPVSIFYTFRLLCQRSRKSSNFQICIIYFFYEFYNIFYKNWIGGCCASAYFIFLPIILIFSYLLFTYNLFFRRLLILSLGNLYLNRNLFLCPGLVADFSTVSISAATYY